MRAGTRGASASTVRPGTTNPTVSRFLDMHMAAPCLRCGVSIQKGQGWAMLAQVFSDRDVSGGRFCGRCLGSFAAWLRGE